jgi:hypothetical protein
LIGAAPNVVYPHWMIEGVAEYIAYGNQAAGAYPVLNLVRSYLRSGAWNSDIDAIDQLWDTDSADLVYGIGFLAWHCIATTFGEDKLIAFATKAFHGSPTLAALSVLGTPLADVLQSCASYIRRVAS